MKTNRPAFRIGCLIFAASTMTTTPSFAQTQEPAGATATAAVISSVAVTQASLHSSVRVEGAGRSEVRASRMQNPERLVLDFSATRLAVQKSVIPGVAAPVRGVRLGQFRPDVARVVVDLTAAAPYQILREGPAVVISFDMQPESPVEPAVATTTIASLNASKPQPNFQYDLSAPRVVPVRASKHVSNRVPRFALPSELTQPSFVLASFSGKDEPVRPIAAQEAAQQAMAQAGNAAATVGAAPQAAAAAGPSKYSGEPISVNLKDVDLRDFFRLIHEISGLNVVLDPQVKGTLTIVLDEVPWDQALDIVLKNNDLARQLDGNVLRIATVDTLRKEAESRRAEQEAEALAVDKQTVTRFLSYAHSKDVLLTVKKFLSQRGDVVADERTNAIIISDIPAVMPNIDRLLTQLDRKTQEVEIEARVVAATRSFAREIGTQLGFGLGNSSTHIGGSSAAGTSPLSTFGISPRYPIIGTTAPSPTTG